jgi:hypothetical protein
MSPLVRRGFNAAADLARRIGDRSMKRARMSSGAQNTMWRIWFTIAIHSAPAERRATIRTRIASMFPVRDFGTPVAVPVNAARAAAIASTASVLPARCRA